jgi:hypothetical protein
MSVSSKKSFETILAGIILSFLMYLRHDVIPVRVIREGAFGAQKAFSSRPTRRLYDRTDRQFDCLSFGEPWIFLQGDGPAVDDSMNNLHHDVVSFLVSCRAPTNSV